MSNRRIVQIIPAERGWHVVARGKDRRPDGEASSWWSEVICWALLDDGEVEPMIAGGHHKPELATDALICEDWLLPEYSVFSPVESWTYTTSGGDKPDGDWELVSTCPDNESGGVLATWRGTP